MAAIALTADSVSAIKNALRQDYDDVKSSHLSEAIAASLGYRTHAALIAALPVAQDDPPIVLVDSAKFVGRLVTLGYPDDPEMDFEFLLNRIPGMVTTEPFTAFDYEYRTDRQRAWRNLIVCGVNEGLRRKLFSLRPDDNRWDDRHEALMEFKLPNGLPALACFEAMTLGELTVRVAVHPKGNAIRSWNAGFDAGDALASSWLERLTGCWVQSHYEAFNCRRALLPQLAQIEVEPLGYGDRGHVV